MVVPVNFLMFPNCRALSGSCSLLNFSQSLEDKMDMVEGYANLSSKDRGSEEMGDLWDSMGFEDSRHNLLVAVGDLVIFLRAWS